jgi:hypothetical protein
VTEILFRSQAGFLRDPLALDAFVAVTGLQIREILDTSVGPANDDSISAVAAAQAEGQRQFGLGEVAGAALDQT